MAQIMVNDTGKAQIMVKGTGKAQIMVKGTGKARLMIKSKAQIKARSFMNQRDFETALMKEGL